MKGLQRMHLFVSYHLIWALSKNMGKKVYLLSLGNVGCYIIKANNESKL